MNRNFRFKGTCQLSYSDAAPSLGYGPPIYALIVTLENGFSIQMPQNVVEQILEPTDEESSLFFDGLKERLAPPRQMMPTDDPTRYGVRMKPEDDGSMTLLPFDRKKK